MDFGSDKIWRSYAIFRPLTPAKEAMFFFLVLPVLPVLPVVKFGQGVGFLSHLLGWLAHNAHRALRLVPLGLDPMGYDGDHPTHRLDLVRPRFRGLTRLYT